VIGSWNERGGLVSASSLERARRSRLGEQPCSLLTLDPGAIEDLAPRGQAVAFSHQLVLGALQPGEMAQRTVGEHGGVAELGDEPLHGPLDRRSCVRAERHPAGRVEAIKCLKQGGDSLLDELEPLDMLRAPVAARDGQDLWQAGFDDLGDGPLVARFGRLDERLPGVGTSRAERVRMDLGSVVGLAAEPDREVAVFLLSAGCLGGESLALRLIERSVVVVHRDGAAGIVGGATRFPVCRTIRRGACASRFLTGGTDRLQGRAGPGTQAAPPECK
jgi:hypothetical protein